MLQKLEMYLFKKAKKSTLYWVLVIVFVRMFILEPYIVPSESMSRTMENGDIVIATKYNYGFSRMSIPIVGGFLPFWKNRSFAHDPKRGDVICFSLDKQPGRLYTKRIIGVGGDKVQIKSGVVYVNNHPLEMKKTGEYNLKHDNGNHELMDVYQFTFKSGKTYEILRKKNENLHWRNVETDNTEIFEVPEKHVFCIGDNMHFSKDFRFFDFTSSISYDRIIGKPHLIIFGSSSRLPMQENWINWILRLPYSVLHSIWNVKWSRIGKFV